VISFRDYISYAEKQLEIAEKEIETGKSGDPYLTPSVLMSWSAIESFVNNRLDEFDSLPHGLFDLHEKAFLTEKHLAFENSGQNAGQFTIKGTAHKKLSDKIMFLIAKCGGTVDKGKTPWQDFDKLKNVRDSLVHPRRTKQTVVDTDLARECVSISKDVIAFISEGLGHKVEF
jgi:hypothetical protein